MADGVNKSQTSTPVENSSTIQQRCSAAQQGTIDIEANTVHHGNL